MLILSLSVYVLNFTIRFQRPSRETETERDQLTRYKLPLKEVGGGGGGEIFHLYCEASDIVAMVAAS